MLAVYNVCNMLRLKSDTPGTLCAAAVESARRVADDGHTQTNRRFEHIFNFNQWLQDARGEEEGSVGRTISSLRHSFSYNTCMSWP